LAAITTAINALSAAFAAAQTARQAAKEKTSTQNQMEDILDQLITQLAAYVESIAGGNEALILSAGMDMRAAAVASTSPPDQPQALTPTAGDRDGEIDLTWDAVTGAKSYVIDKSSDSGTPTSWAHEGVSTRANFTADGLISGTRYWFRVAAVNKQRPERLERSGHKDRAVGAERSACVARISLSASDHELTLMRRRRVSLHGYCSAGRAETVSTAVRARLRFQILNQA